MAVFNTIKETSEVDAALSLNGAESIIVDGKLVGLRIGPLRIAPMKGGDLFVSMQADYTESAAQKEAS